MPSQPQYSPDGRFWGTELPGPVPGQIGEQVLVLPRALQFARILLILETVPLILYAIVLIIASAENPLVIFAAVEVLAVSGGLTTWAISTAVALGRVSRGARTSGLIFGVIAIAAGILTLMYLAANTTKPYFYSYTAPSQNVSAIDAGWVGGAVSGTLIVLWNGVIVWVLGMSASVRMLYATKR